METPLVINLIITGRLTAMHTNGVLLAAFAGLAALSKFALAEPISPVLMDRQVIVEQYCCLPGCETCKSWSCETSSCTFAGSVCLSISFASQGNTNLFPRAIVYLLLRTHRFWCRRGGHQTGCHQ